MQRNVLFHRDKQLLALERERNILYRQTRIMVPLHPPLERGWVRQFRLTRAAAQRPDAAVLRTILGEINLQRFSNTRQFGPRKSWGRHRRLHYNDQSLKPIAEWRWPRLGWPDEWRTRYFRLTDRVWLHQRAREYVFVRDDFFELFSVRHYVRELPLLDPDAMRRLSELSAGIGETGQFRLSRLHGHSSCPWRHDPRRRTRERMAKRRIHLALRGDWEAEMNRVQFTGPVHFSLLNCPDESIA